VKRIRLPEAETLAFDRLHTEPITGLVARRGGRRVLTCDRDKLVAMWDGITGKMAMEFRAHQEQVSLVALNPTRDLAASYDPKAGIKVWDVMTGIVQRNFPLENNEIQCLRFSLDWGFTGSRG
jgi:WD40 repeat protein